MRALVIEDDPVQVKLVDAALRRMGFEVITAEDGIDGLIALFDHDVFDLAIVDWHTERLSGLSFLCAVRAEPRFDSMLVLMLTAEMNKDNVIKAIKSGASQYVVKPFKQAVMIAKLQEMGFVEVSQNGLPEGAQRLGIPQDAETATIVRTKRKERGEAD
ncbi:MAG: response regulator [Planctomycetota bacterium]|jgi:two-component system chemotaxis response regulator CheY|nr:response regulator [Planctomycetota bacterium]